VRGWGGRAAVVGECGFNGFHYKVEKEGGKGVGQALLDEGEWRQYGWYSASSTMEHGRASHGGVWPGSTVQANGGSGDRGGRRAGEQAEWAAQAGRPAGPEWATSIGWCSLGWCRIERKRHVMAWAELRPSV
jgi:hypothetical protein